MELCYEGGLVMPSSYAMMDENEMTYVEGGVTVKKHKLDWGGDAGFCWDVYLNNKESKAVAGSPASYAIGLLGKYGPVIAAVVGCYSWLIGQKNKGKGVIVTVDANCPMFWYATVKSR